MVLTKRTPQSPTTSPKPAQTILSQALPSADPSPESISRRAYEIWESRGRPDGTSVEDWLNAEAELKSASPFRVGRREAARAS